jgi:hypothetical protein
VLSLGLTLSGVSHGQADMVELHGYIEPCTIANYQEMYTECETCAVSKSAPKACEESVGRRGYQKRCRTRGDAKGWEEVWCIAKGSASQAPAPPTPAAPRPLNLPALLLSAALFAAFLWMWRAWSHERAGR